MYKLKPVSALICGDPRPVGPVNKMNKINKDKNTYIKYRIE